MRLVLTTVMVSLAWLMGSQSFAFTPEGRKYLDRSGEKYGRLTAQSISHFNVRDQAYWLCSCSCGGETVAFGGNLTSGQTQSCGCLAREGNNLRHGHARDLAHSKEYDCWVTMKSRVYNPKNKRYPHYGGKGVKVCQRWLDSFANFLEDMGPKPTPKHSIHRKDNDGDYEPTNCIWAIEEQWWTKSTSRNIEFNGQIKCCAEWAAITGIALPNIYARLKLGWSVDKTLTTPVKHR